MEALTVSGVVLITCVLASSGLSVLACYIYICYRERKYGSSNIAPKVIVQNRANVYKLVPRMNFDDSREWFYNYIIRPVRSNAAENIDGVDLLETIKSFNIYMKNKHRYCGSYNYIIDDKDLFRHDVSEMVRRIKTDFEFIQLVGVSKYIDYCKKQFEHGRMYMDDESDEQIAKRIKFFYDNIKNHPQARDRLRVIYNTLSKYDKIPDPIDPAKTVNDSLTDVLGETSETKNEEMEYVHKRYL